MKIFERRQSSGIEDLLIQMRGVVIQVDQGDALPYLHELYLMGPYRFSAAFKNTTHNIYILTSQPEFPRLIILEPLAADYADEITMFNRLYPLSSQKPNARYIGEIFSTKDVAATQKTLESHNIRFNYHHETKNLFFTESHFAFTFPSDFTFNRVGYTQVDIDDYDALNLGTPIELDASIVDSLNQVEQFGKDQKLDSLVLGLDHLATRILAGEREDAILEFLTMSNHYFWGAYNIAAMNSSTNVTRNGYVDDDKNRPRKSSLPTIRRPS